MKFKMVAVSALAAAIAGTAAVSVVFAASGDDGAVGGTASAAEAGRGPKARQGGDGFAPAFATRVGPHGEPGIAAHRGPRGRHFGGVFTAAAEELGMTAEELRAALVDGKTILDVATEKGRDPDQFTSDVADAVRANIEAAVANGDIDQEKVDRMLADLDEHVARALSATGKPGGCDGKHDGPAADSTATNQT